MRESLSSFIRREAGPDAENQLRLVRHLAPAVLITSGHDFDELRQLKVDGPGWENSFGSEYVSADWPEVPVEEPLSCITIRPFKSGGYNTVPYELVELLAGHLRDVMEGAELPNFDGVIRFGYIEDKNLVTWKDAARRWRVAQEEKPGVGVDGCTVASPIPDEGGDEPVAGSTGPTAAEGVNYSGDYRFSMLATPRQLIDAFGRFTGMDSSWFKGIKDSPALLAARKVRGQGGRGHILEPRFCPFEVVQWLTNDRRKKGRSLSQDKAWELLEKNFPRVYNHRSVADPRRKD